MTEVRRGYDMSTLVTEVARRLHAKNLSAVEQTTELTEDPFSLYREWDDLHPINANAIREAVLPIIWSAFDVMDEIDAESVDTYVEEFLERGILGKEDQ